MDEASSAMKLRLLALLCLVILGTAPAQAHVGSPDVFFDGMVGPWLAHITIRMPNVVPGQAEILVQVQSKEPVTVTFAPLTSGIAISNAPPPEIAQPVRGETNLYSGQLWLMTSGAYSIDVHVRGTSGDGEVQVPIDSVARAQLPLPLALGQVLVALGLLLFVSAMAIIAAAASESTLASDTGPGVRNRRKYWMAASVTGLVLALGLWEGKKWWDSEESSFRTRIMTGGWPDMDAQVRIEGSQRILSLNLGRKAFNLPSPNARAALVPDHGKMLHLFMVGKSNPSEFCHLHPIYHGGAGYEVALPPLPEGDYEMFCDLTLAQSGFSSTATNVIHLPGIPAVTPAVGTNYLDPDPDDSWSISGNAVGRENPEIDTPCKLAGGTEIVWKSHSPLRANRDAALQFQVRDESGRPAHLEPYMGMMSHAAIVRSDGQVFAHLHPSGNYSMAAQNFFEAKMSKEDDERGRARKALLISGWKNGVGRWPPGGGSSFVALPYEFPTPGDYTVWVQIKTGGQVQTAAFNATVN